MSWITCFFLSLTRHIYNLIYCILILIIYPIVKKYNLLLCVGITPALSWGGKIENGIPRSYRRTLPPKTSVLISRFKKSRDKDLFSYYQHYCVGVVIGAYTVLTAGFCTMPSIMYTYENWVRLLLKTRSSLGLRALWWHQFVIRCQNVKHCL